MWLTKPCPFLSQYLSITAPKHVVWREEHKQLHQAPTVRHEANTPHFKELLWGLNETTHKKCLTW